ncbi:MAG: T9SS type A sorting domain-containing protein [Ignavibacteria bacterium]|nr:T9SS type A sorting domain-containing protein [Ignavibacteria bacterium]
MRKIVFPLLLLSALFFQNSFAQRYWNMAAQFNGSNYIAVPPSSRMNNLSGSFSAECWFNPGSITSAATLFGKSSFRILLEPHETDFVRIRVQTNNSTRLYSSTTSPFKKNEWNHVTVTYDSTSTGKLQIYKNGVLDVEMTGTNLGPQYGSDSLFIGTSVYGAYKGMIDDIRIWDGYLFPSSILNYFRNPFVFSFYSSGFQYSTIPMMLSATFEYPSSGYSTGLYFSDYNHQFINRGGVVAVNIGMNPSETNSTNHALGGIVDGYVSVQQNSNINLNGPVTVETWINPYSFSGIANLITKGSDYNINLNLNGTLSYSFGNGITATTTNVIQLNQWSHVAATCDENGASNLYLNGLLIATRNFGSRPTPGTSPLVIGGQFYGNMDAVKISNFVKSQDEVRKSMISFVDLVSMPELPQTTASYDFEYQTYSSTNIAANFSFSGYATYVSSGSPFNIQASPVLGTYNSLFPNAYLLKYPAKKVPEIGTAGYTNDTLNVSTSNPINDLKLYINIGHVKNNELRIKLYSPQGDSLIVFDQNTNQSGFADNINTIFNDAAEKPLVNGKYVSFSPTIKPLNSLNGKFAGRNPQGKWRLQVTDLANSNSGVLYSWGLRINNSVDVKNISSEIPSKYNLSQNYPNPFNPSTKINFSLSKAGIVSLKVFDIAGREVSELVNKNLPAGSYEAEFNGAELSSGVYFYTLKSEAFTETKKMVLVK